jgi:hypothetical protein
MRKSPKRPYLEKRKLNRHWKRHQTTLGKPLNNLFQRKVQFFFPFLKFYKKDLWLGGSMTMINVTDFASNLFGERQSY